MKFREYHLYQILESFSFNLPLDVHLNRYFRSHKSLGSKDRSFLSETIYTQMRQSKPAFYTGPVHAEALCPTPIYDKLSVAYGPQEALSICRASIERAPVTLRINPLKTTRSHLLDRWKPLYNVSACRRSPLGIQFHQKINFSQLPEFREGLFEVQDEASQLMALLVAPTPGQHILDYCAGAGGKTLAFAHQTEGKGQIYLHDIRPQALSEAKKRCRRAGIQNVQFKTSLPATPKMDWILVDAPCTGSGTYRRNPDLKWKFSIEMLERILQEQRSIFKEALTFLKPQGKIVYVTCSVLSEENEQQAAYFCDVFDLQIEKHLRTLPGEEGMDGFYGVILSRKPSF